MALIHVPGVHTSTELSCRAIYNRIHECDNLEYVLATENMLGKY
jgi:hypothetical protein